MNIKGVIKKRGYTLEQVASKIGINRVTLSQNLSGNPSLTTLRKIADTIGCNVGEFFRDELEEIASNCKCPHCGKTINIDITIK